MWQILLLNNPYVWGVLPVVLAQLSGETGAAPVTAPARNTSETANCSSSNF